MNRVAIVTGAGQGIGRAIASRLARDGFALALVDLNATTLRAVRREIQDEGQAAMMVEADLTDFARIPLAIDRAVAEWGRVDALVNNAGRVVTKPFLDVTEADWDAMLSLNLKAVSVTIQAAARLMIAHGIPGRIVNISSIAGRAGRADQAPYAAAKAGVISLTQSAALALAPHGITVNAVCPGVVDTPMTRRIHEDRAKALRISPDESLRRMIARIPLGRMATPGDIAAAVTFFCSPGAAYITGQALNVCGGMDMH